MDFNPRSREGSDVFVCEVSDYRGDFNPRSREGSDYIRLRFHHILNEFQSTLPRRERHSNQLIWVGREPFQSTLPRRERQQFGPCGVGWYYISIHAPAKGATRCGDAEKGAGYISIHAPAKGATMILFAFFGTCGAISIHAPAKGATLYFTSSRRALRFQSTLPRRERLNGAMNKIDTQIFQSTLPRRERLFLCFYFSMFHIFQSTLPRRERLISRRRLCVPILFQSTLPRRERHKQIFHKCQVPYFNPRSREGSDRIFSCHNNIWVDFNPRSREGSDSNFYLKSYLILGKNCLKLLKSLNISILQNIFKHSMAYFQVRIPQSIYVSLAFAPNL